MLYFHPCDMFILQLELVPLDSPSPVLTLSPLPLATPFVPHIYESVPWFLFVCSLVLFFRFHIKESEASPALFFLCSLDSGSLRKPLCYTLDKSVEPINSFARHRAASPVCVISQGSGFILCPESYITLSRVSPEPTEESAEKLLLTRE